MKIVAVSACVALLSAGGNGGFVRSRKQVHIFTHRRGNERGRTEGSNARPLSSRPLHLPLLAPVGRFSRHQEQASPQARLLIGAGAHPCFLWRTAPRTTGKASIVRVRPVFNKGAHRSARPLSDTGRVLTIEALCFAERLCFPLGTMFRSRSDDDSLEERNKSGKGWACGGKVLPSAKPSNMPKAYLNGFTEGETLGAD